MESNLEILINHLQDEADFLKSEMDKCIEDWDFKGAEAFKTPFFYTNMRLRILKNLQNPNFSRISSLIGTISRMEKNLSRKIYSENTILDEQTRMKMEEHFKSTKLKIIERSKLELMHLQSIEPKPQIDDDKILSLLDELYDKSIKKIELELIENKIYLQLNRNNGNVIMKLISNDNGQFERNLTKDTKTILRRIGFDDEYTKTYTNYLQIEKLTILEEIAIICFEVFNLLNGEMKIIVDLPNSKND